MERSARLGAILAAYLVGGVLPAVIIVLAAAAPTTAASARGVSDAWPMVSLALVGGAGPALLTWIATTSRRRSSRNVWLGIVLSLSLVGGVVVGLLGSLLTELSRSPAQAEH